MAQAKEKVSFKLKIKKGDTVKVIAGSDRNTVGQVLEVIPSENKAIVEGVNVRIKHRKATEGDAGGRVEKTMPVHISNLMVVDANGKPSRVGRRLENGKLVRYTKTNGKTLS